MDKAASLASGTKSRYCPPTPFTAILHSAKSAIDFATRGSICAARAPSAYPALLLRRVHPDRPDLPPPKMASEEQTNWPQQLISTPPHTDALEGKGPQRRPQKRLDKRLEEVAKAVGGGYCQLQMPLKLALGVRETVAGRRLGALDEGGGGVPPPFQRIPGRPLLHPDIARSSRERMSRRLKESTISVQTATNPSVAPEDSTNAIRSGCGRKHGRLVTPGGRTSAPRARRVRSPPPPRKHGAYNACLDAPRV